MSPLLVLRQVSLSKTGQKRTPDCEDAMITKIPKGGDLVGAQRHHDHLLSRALARSAFFDFSAAFSSGDIKRPFAFLDAKTESAFRRFVKIPRRSLSSVCSGTTVRHIVPFFPEISPTI